MKHLLTIAALAGVLTVHSQCPSEETTTLIREADRMRTELTGNFWEEWSAIPFRLLLIEDEKEYVFNSTETDSTFRTGCHEIAYRDRIFSPHFLATFPLLGFKPTIVVGTPEKTRQTRERWVTTLFHEHFHQLQFSHPEYYTAQQNLGLANGDKTGMWMLNYPFPYENDAIIGKIQEISQHLLKVVAGETSPEVFQKYRALKTELSKLLGPHNYKYLNLQLWQEGFARFVEIRMLEAWISTYRSESSLFTLDQLESLKDGYYDRIRKDLTAGDLAGMTRDYFYSLGAAEALLISSVNPDWEDSYFRKLYDTDHLLPAESNR